MDSDAGGSLALYAWSALGLVGLLALAASMPQYLPFAFIGLAGLIALTGMMRTESDRMVLLFFGATAVITSQQGLQLYEIVYGLYFLPYLGWWYLSRFVLYRRPAGGLLMDRVALVLLVLGLGLGTVLGVLHGASLSGIREDLTGFGMLAFFFPIREFVARHKHGPEIIVALICWLSVYVSVRTFLNFRAIILSATHAWQIADARPGYNALQLTSAIPLSASLFMVTKKKVVRGALLAVFAISLSSLILIRYRGFWVACIASLVLFVFLLPRVARRRLLMTTAFGTGALVLGLSLVFGDFAVSIIESVISRFSTLSNALTSDISLINRFVEADAALSSMGTSAFTGVGLGTKYSYFSLVYRSTLDWAFIHSGYVSILYKLGLWGTLLTLALWVHAAWSGCVVCRRIPNPTHAAIGLAAGVVLAGMVFSVMTEGPWFQPNQMFGFAALCGLISGIRERHGFV